MNFEEYTENKLWPILVETVHTNVMYPTHKAYTRDVILKSNPNISPGELVGRLNLSLGEAIVILNELKTETKPPSI